MNGQQEGRGLRYQWLPEELFPEEVKGCHAWPFSFPSPNPTYHKACKELDLVSPPLVDPVSCLMNHMGLAIWLFLPAKTAVSYSSA